MEYIKYVIDYGIIGLLVFMSLAGFAISIERYLFFRTMKLYDYPERKRLELALTERLHLIATPMQCRTQADTNCCLTRGLVGC